MATKVQLVYNLDIMIEVKKVTKTYGKKGSAFTALKDVSLTVADGSSIAIIGKSGSGKSTLMHLLALLDKPTSGTILVGEEDTSKLEAKEINSLRNKSFGFVFQQFFLNANDSVLSNVVLPLKIAGIGNRARMRRGMEALKAVELEEKADSKAIDLSGGQKQRVCIARALINEPDVIFADEPTGNLDSVTGGKIMNLLFDLNKKKGITLIIVTHDEDLAKRCKIQIRMKDGRIMKGGK